ncbi:hypothetical protein [Nitrosomonas ureae]|nr:hypothetical protein [Nitrosomonas ureae]
MLLAEGKGCADIGNEYLLKHTKKVYVCLLGQVLPKQSSAF